jgi:glycine/D-amino acid oxidase-like deaminating enzyme
VELTSDFPYWTVRNGLIQAYPPLENDVRCEVLVVGGGITAALLADELRRRSISCAVVDRRDIGHGSTSASTALLLYEIDTPLPELIAKVGRKHAERAYRLGIEAIAKIQDQARGHAGFRLRPSLKLARNSKALAGLREEYGARRAAGISVRWLNGAELKERFGIAREGAIQSTDGGDVDPYRMTHHLLGKLTGSVFDRTKIIRYEPAPSGITAYTDRGTTIRAKAIFFATGLETKNILPRGIVEIHSTYAVASEPLQDLSFWPRRALIWETGDPYLYARTTPDNRVLIGGADDDILKPSERDAQLLRKTRDLSRAFRRLFPGHAIEPAFSWAGAFGSTKDGLPYIGPFAGFPHGYFALGFGGNGITFSAIAATILADLFECKRNGDAGIFGFSRRTRHGF